MDCRIALLLVSLLFTWAASAITRRDLTSRYGPPSWRQTVSGGNTVTAEQFVPEPGVVLTVRYDDKGAIKEIRIAPLGPETDERGTRSLRTDQAERILNQIVPRKQQPAPSAQGTTGACHHATMSTNETLSITRDFTDCDPKGVNVTVTWK
jgi:hypothetical protein